MATAAPRLATGCVRGERSDRKAVQVRLRLGRDGVVKAIVKLRRSRSARDVGNSVDGRAARTAAAAAVAEAVEGETRKRWRRDFGMGGATWKSKNMSVEVP